MTHTLEVQKSGALRDYAQGHIHLAQIRNRFITTSDVPNYMHKDNYIRNIKRFVYFALACVKDERVFNLRLIWHSISQLVYAKNWSRSGSQVLADSDGL